MKPIDISGPNGVPARPSATAATPVRSAEPVRRPSLAEAEAKAPVLSPANAGSAPIDRERVAEIRKAIEEDRYPVIPMRVADAMIAAGLLLKVK